MKEKIAETGADVVNLPVDRAWLALSEEEVLEPDLPIIDAHHHMRDRPGARYMLPDLLTDITDGHNVVATVCIEDCIGYRSHGPIEFRPVGETDIMAGIAAGWISDASAPRVNAAIVGYADLFLGAAVGAVLEAHLEAGRERFRGIRQLTVWAAEASLRPAHSGSRRPTSPGMLGEGRFREGFACLAPLNVSFDAWLYHPQLPELVDLARRFPRTQIVVDHMGGPVRVGSYKDSKEEAFAQWAASVDALSRCPNVCMKLGGLGMRLLGFGFRDRDRPPSSSELAAVWRPYVEHCIACFGTDRCMFEANFPVDKAYFSYRTVWNAFKRLAAGASTDEKRNLFSATAARAYRLRLST